jgi:type II secretory pathway pseudopilin PulG
MKLFFKKTNRAFTLVETLVAISIFSMSVLGLLSILASGISNTSYAKQKIVATYLAQEGIEYIRNMRDTYVLYDSDGQTGWNNFNTKVAGGVFHSVSICATTNGCYINADASTLNYTIPSSQAMTSITLPACTDSTCSNAPLHYNSNTGIYGYTGVDGYAGVVSSGFSRKIQINQINANETEVFSTVYWTQGSGNYSVTFSEDLFNWVQ